MKVTIGGHKEWFGPYQQTELLRYLGVPEETHVKIAEKLCNTKYNDFCEWIYKKRKRKVKVKIHEYDTWNFNSTLAPIIIPMLKQLKETKVGIPGSMPALEHQSDECNGGLQLSFDFYKEGDHMVMDLAVKQWEEILDKMIFAFESAMPESNWEDKFWKQKPELDLSEHPEDVGKNTRPLRWLVEGECDFAGMRAYQNRIQEGYELFGKYFSNLWD